LSAVAVWLVVDPHPGSPSVLMIKISPHVPSSSLCLLPIPQRPGLLGVVVHVLHISPIAELGEPRVRSEVALADVVSRLVAGDVVATDWQCGGEDASGPAVVVATVRDGEGSVGDGDGVVWADCGHVVADTKQGQGLGARLIAYEGVAVVARKAASPIVLVCRENCRLHGESLIQWL